MKTRTVRPVTNSEKSQHLVRRLGSRDVEERRLAKEEFLRMASEDPALFHADLADIIKAITGNRKRAAIFLSGLSLAAYFGYFIMVSLSSLPNFIELFLPLIWAASLLGLTTVVGWGISSSVTSLRKKRLAECIADIDDLNALPALIELLEFTNPAVRSAIMPPITRMLSRLRASDGYLLGFLHRTALARILSTPRSKDLPPPFFVSVLQAFEQIGDSQVLPAVSWLAQGKGAAGNDPVIQEAARTCEGYLQEQLRRHQAPYLLLRPSSLEEATQTLLRPVATAPDTAPHELLRADNTPLEPTVPLIFHPQEELAEPLPIQLQGYKEP